MCNNGGSQPMVQAVSSVAQAEAQAKADAEAQAAKSAPYQKKKTQSLLSAYSPAVAASNDSTTATTGASGKTTLGS